MNSIKSQIYAIEQKFVGRKAASQEDKEFAEEAFQLVQEFLRHASLNLKILTEICRSDRSILPGFFEKIGPLAADIKKIRERVQHGPKETTTAQIPEAICHTRSGAATKNRRGPARK